MNEITDLGLEGCIQQHQAGLHVFRKILPGLPQGFRHDAGCGKMQDSLDAVQRRSQLLAVADVASNESELTGQEAVSRGEVVIDQNFVTVARQLPRRVAADVTRPACNKNSHEIVLSFLRRYASLPRYCFALAWFDTLCRLQETASATRRDSHYI